jgi:hypothetical protein
MGETGAVDGGRLGVGLKRDFVLEEGLRDDRPRCSDADEYDPLLERLRRYHEIVGGRVRERVVPLDLGDKVGG